MASQPVATLLATSRQAHTRYRQIHHATKGADLRAMGEAIQQALSARVEAHALDPNLSDLAWAEDMAANKGASSEAMLVFLARYLTPVEARA